MSLPIVKETKTYRDNGGRLFEHYFEKDGKYHGEYKSYYPSGMISIHSFHEDGKKHGEYKCFRDDSGELWGHRFYDHDILHGEYKMYYKNGECSEFYLYDHGKKHGDCIWYYGNGCVWRRMVFQHDSKIGMWSWYHENGLVSAFHFYKNNKRHGECFKINDVGKIVHHRFWNNGTREELFEYTDDINNITDAEFMNLSMVFGENFFSQLDRTKIINGDVNAISIWPQL